MRRGYRPNLLDTLCSERVERSTSIAAHIRQHLRNTDADDIGNITEHMAPMSARFGPDIDYSSGWRFA